MVEEFLMRKGMQNTLNQFRQEWKRPVETESLLSWYEMSLKLQLPDMSGNAKYETVLENLTWELTTEASLRMRRAPEVIVSGLACVPRSSTLPAIETHLMPATVFDRTSTKHQHGQHTGGGPGTGGDFTGSRKLALTEGGADMTKRYYNPGGKRIQDAAAAAKNKMSSSNWIPDETRYRQLGRDLSVAKENLHDILMRAEETRRENRALQQTDLERAHSMESLGVKHKISCACCLQKFSFVNLRLKVSHKAIIDIRKSWSNGAQGWWSAHDERWSVVPRCYDEVLVCLLCSQFFHKQAEYRPSFEQIKYEERRQAYLETKRREKEYWDPLRMCEKDRELMEAELQRQQEVEARQMEQQLLAQAAAAQQQAAGTVPSISTTAINDANGGAATSATNLGSPTAMAGADAGSVTGISVANGDVGSGAAGGSVISGVNANGSTSASYVDDGTVGSFE